MFGHDAGHTFQSSASGPLAGHLLWRTFVGRGLPLQGLAVAADGSTLVSTGTSQLVRIAATGSVQWTESLPVAATSSPALACGGQAFLGAIRSDTQTAYVDSVSLADGGVVWEQPVYAAEPGATLHVSAIALDANAGIVVQAAANNVAPGSRTVALRTDGEIAWQWDSSLATYSSPTVGAGLVFTGWLDALAANSGSVAWADTSDDARPASTFAQGMLFTSREARSPTGATLWPFDEFHDNPSAWGGLAVSSDGLVVVGTAPGIDAYSTDGSLKWRFRDSWPTGNHYWVMSQVVLDANDNAYFVVVDQVFGLGLAPRQAGRISRVYAVDRNGSLLWRYETAEGTDEPPAAVAIGANRTLLLLWDDFLWSFGS